ncbi:glycosyltransferase family 2 protein [Edaphobacter dinghuensis]|uniref:Rhamnosyltransferase n=1 Tax=Edaphobacter dinghuensis TaxID=1560005 RepID=A0A917HSA2_9BACT|nr:glycosyltransferase family 2 protein [Edaphobacter dinghuensis]GGG87821.1 rhamnosyltransferase [Edaphobacter dinghuensis]
MCRSLKDAVTELSMLGSAAEMNPRVICVVVNWNGWQDTIECLFSLRQQDYDRLEVLVVDNGSTNDSSQRILDAHPWVTLIQLKNNVGFPSGCNAGTRLAIQRGADYVWLLNNDTIVPADTVRKLLRVALSNPQAGAVGAVLYYMYSPTKVQAWGGGRINVWTGFVTHFEQATSFEGNTYLTGACMLLPRKVCQEVGIFYEGFFMYCDDSDFCLRLRSAGYELSIAKDTAILHKEGASSPKRSPLIDRFATTSGMRLLKRHAPLPFISITLFLLLRMANRVRRIEWKNLYAVWQGIVVYLKERHLKFTDQI